MAYYKRTVLLNKANLAWVCSEGTRGHEIQSLSLAEAICERHILNRFQVSRPWDWFLPRLMPGLTFGLNRQLTDCATPPTADFIISCGRRAAGIGRFAQAKWFKNQQLKHIQILNPGNHFRHYHLLLMPEHDRITHPKVMTFRGNLHPFDPPWFRQQKQLLTKPEKPIVALFIGQPNKAYFEKEFKAELETIRHAFSEARVFICGSPRLNAETQQFIRAQVQPGEGLWLTKQDGENPYRYLLVQAVKLFVTADSINMLNESAASDAALSVLAADYKPSKKHGYFIDSIQQRLTALTDLGNNQPLAHPMTDLLQNKLFLERLKLT